MTLTVRTQTSLMPRHLIRVPFARAWMSMVTLLGFSIHRDTFTLTILQQASACESTNQSAIPNRTTGNQETESVATQITAFCVADDDASLLLGYSNGYVRPITIQWKIEYRDGSVDTNILPSDSDSNNSDRPVLTELPNGLVRVHSIESIDFHEPIPALNAPVRCVDWLNASCDLWTRKG